MIYFYFAQHEFFFFLVYTLINPLIDERRKKMDNYLNEILFELNHFFFPGTTRHVPEVFIFISSLNLFVILGIP